MKVALSAFVGVLLVSSAFAQGGSKQDDSHSGWNDALSVARSGWAWVTKHGEKTAKQLVEEAPGKYRQARIRAQELVKQGNKIADPKNVAEKKALLAELWRVRSSLDLLAMVNPELVRQTTGIDVKQLTELRTKYAKTFADYQKKLK